MLNYSVFEKIKPEKMFTEVLSLSKRDRTSRPEVFCKKGVVRNFSNSQENTCARVFFNKVAGLKPANLLKKRLRHRYFSVNFAKFLEAPFLTEHLRYLLLT